MNDIKDVFYGTYLEITLSVFLIVLFYDKQAQALNNRTFLVGTLWLAIGLCLLMVKQDKK